MSTMGTTPQDKTDRPATRPTHEVVVVDCQDSTRSLNSTCAQMYLQGWRLVGTSAAPGTALTPSRTNLYFERELPEPEPMLLIDTAATACLPELGRIVAAALDECGYGVSGTRLQDDTVRVTGTTPSGETIEMSFRLDEDGDDPTTTQMRYSAVVAPNVAYGDDVRFPVHQIGQVLRGVAARVVHFRDQVL